MGVQSAEKTVAAMAALGADPSNIHAAIGPNIGQCCFETQSDVPEAMVKVLGGQAEEFIASRGRSYYVDLKGVNKALLERAGVRHVEVSRLCTCCREDLFWSYRRNGDKRGSQGALIQCRREAKV